MLSLDNEETFLDLRSNVIRTKNAIEKLSLALWICFFPHSNVVHFYRIKITLSYDIP